MNKTLITVAVILGLSIIAWLAMYYLIGFSQKKALIISGGAGAAMILFDVVILNLVRKR